MARRLVTISFTGLNAGGGVPKVNRDLHAAFPDRECVHYCWADYTFADRIDMQTLPEWEKARIFNLWLLQTRRVTAEDVVIADGFWAAGLDSLPFAISHCHGIWSHLTKDDVDAGKPPDMPLHHAAQVAFRTRWHGQGKPLVAVSDFIAEQMRLQWGFESTVINNGVDTDVWVPRDGQCGSDKPLIIHAVNDRTNVNKGWRHIQALKEAVDANIWSLDEAAEKMQMSKPFCLAQADLAVHPSGYEGNSMFFSECLSVGLKVVCYEVGFAWKLKQILMGDTGFILPLGCRDNVEIFIKRVQTDLAAGSSFIPKFDFPRMIALKYLDIKVFKESWRAYVAALETR